MDIKLNLPNTKCCDWNELFSQRYHRMFRVSDLDEWGIKEHSIQLIKKQMRSNKDAQSLEIDDSKIVLPDKKTLAVRGLGYWVGSLEWDRNDSTSQNTVISAVISKYWLSAPIAVVGLALGVWFFKDLFSFLKPIGENSMIFLITSILLVLLTGVLNYFVHYFSIKNILKQLTVFLKYKGVSYEFGDDVFNAEKAYEEARLDYEKSLREAQQPGIMATETLTSDYVPQTIADAPASEVIQTQVEPEIPAESDINMVTEQFDAAIDSELYATAIAEENATDELVDAVGNEEDTEYYAPAEMTDDSEVELPVVEEITEEFGDGIGEDLDFAVPEIEEEVSEDGLIVENKDMREPKSEKIKLMADSTLQTQDMRTDEFDSEIDGDVNLVEDSAYALGMQDEIDGEAESQGVFDNADATQIDDFGTEILSPDDAFAQGFSPQVMPEEEFAMDDIVAESDGVEIDNSFEVPEIEEEVEEDVVEDIEVADDFDEEPEVEIADIVKEDAEGEPEVSDDLAQEQLDEYKIEVDEEDGFNDAFDSQEEADIEGEIEESSDFVQHDDADEQALTEISEMTDSFAVPEIAEGYTKPSEDVTEPEIPDDFMVSEITEDMGLTDEEIAEAQGDNESEVFDVPEISEDEDDEGEMVIPEDFMVPEIEDEDNDGFADATEYIVQEFADENDETNIESYGDSFQEEEDVDEQEVTPEDIEAIYGKEEIPFDAEDDDAETEKEMGSFDGFDEDAEVSEEVMIDPEDEEKISFSDDDFAEPEVQEDSVVDVEPISEDEDFADVTEYTEDFVAPEIEIAEDEEEDEWKDWD